MCDSTQGSLCQSPMKIHQKYVDTVTCFTKTWTKGHWPLNDLWPHVCWGHKCDSTQGSLYPSPMKIHQSMWIQWSILQNTTYIIHTDGHTYIHTYYVQNEWSHSLFLNKVLARQKVQDQKYSPNCSEISGPNASKMMNLIYLRLYTSFSFLSPFLLYIRVASFPQFGKHRKITEIEYKTENTKNHGKHLFTTQKQ